MNGNISFLMSETCFNIIQCEVKGEAGQSIVKIKLVKT